jgi:hypothetical protein
MLQIGNKIFKSETGGDKSKLVFWNPKEAFPSIGIGHFIWMPSNRSVSFLQDVFSEFLNFCAEKGVVFPAWLQKNQKCPWVSRGDFMSRMEGGSGLCDVKKLRSFLFFHKRIQTEFILVNFLKNLPKVIESLPGPMQEPATEYCNLLLSTPEGCFALIDYNHFKGPGLENHPEYNNKGWGLKQVLERVVKRIHGEAFDGDWLKEPLDIYIESAKDTLTNRVENAPIHKREIERSFIEGWFNRLDRYKDSTDI